MQKMINSVQNYSWGSTDALTHLYGIANPQKKPMAELWMGAHAKNSSYVIGANGQPCSLLELIAKDVQGCLGNAADYGELPFLFKVLCAAQPLSIEVHPSKRAAEIGFAKENAADIPLDAPNRNYKDANHKPELVYALTPFHAMNGFRTMEDMNTLLQPVSTAHPDVAVFLQNQNTANLAKLFASLLDMTGQTKKPSIDGVKISVKSSTR